MGIIIRSKVIKVDTICTNCGNINVITILKHFQKKEKYMKLYCYKCKKVVNHIQLVDKDVYSLFMQNNFGFTEEQLYSRIVKKKVKK